MNIKSPYRIFPLSFAITAQGVLYLAMILVMSLAALNTSNNLLFLVFATLISTFVVSSVFSWSSLKQISLSLQVPENVFEGEKVPVKVSVRNTKRFFPSFSISVGDFDSGAAAFPYAFINKITGRKPPSSHDTERAFPLGFHPCAYFPILRPGETHSELTVQSFPRRGYFRLEEIRVSTRFPFGLFRRSERIGIKGEVLVYPSIKDISTYFHRLPFLPGFLEGVHKGQGENLFTIRPYREGESARIVDWKATAKTRELMSREFTRDEECKFCLILDTQTREQKEGNYWDEFEKAVSLAASIAVHFVERGADMELLTSHSLIPRGAGRNHLYRILRFLAMVQYSAVSPKADSPAGMDLGFPEIPDRRALKEILSDKVFKIILTSKTREIFPTFIRRSSHIIQFNEL